MAKLKRVQSLTSMRKSIINYYKSGDKGQSLQVYKYYKNNGGKMSYQNLINTGYKRKEDKPYGNS